ncbi:MAG TPA: hypothetical protein VFW65_33120 [Pseudonocardiaceae bacterium]|nr:hypothetical protein [Pseudonocardiaceae bacterium]
MSTHLVASTVVLALIILPLVWLALLDVRDALIARRTRRRQNRPDLPSALDFYVRQRARKNEVMRQMRAVVREHRNHPPR